MKIKQVFLSIIFVIALPTKMHAITNDVALLLTTCYSGLATGITAVILKDNPKYNNLEVAVGAIIVGAGTALISGAILYSHTPEYRLKEAQYIIESIYKDRLVSLNPNYTSIYIISIKQMYLYFAYPILEAHERLIELTNSVKNAKSLLIAALNDVYIRNEYDITLNLNIKFELEKVERLISLIEKSLFCLKNCPEYSQQLKSFEEANFQKKLLRIQMEQSRQFARQANAQEEANRIKMAKLHSKN